MNFIENNLKIILSIDLTQIFYLIIYIINIIPVYYMSIYVLQSLSQSVHYLLIIKIKCLRFRLSHIHTIFLQFYKSIVRVVAFSSSDKRYGSPTE